MSSRKKTLRLILGDQLNIRHNWYGIKSDDIVYVMLEMRQETDYVKHHIQKIIGFFLAMRAFAEKLKEKGHRVIYWTIGDENNEQDLVKNLKKLIHENKIECFEYQLPDEYRLDRQLKQFCKALTIVSSATDTEHFLTGRHDLAHFFEGKKQYLMENFYRHMRKKYDVLMDGDDPMGMKWNYDKENRRKLPDEVKIPEPKTFDREIEDIKKEIEEADVNYIGRVDTRNFTWPVTRSEVLRLFRHFLKYCLADFGRYQDALTERSWTVFHSRLSFGLNTKLVSPLEIIRNTEDYWKEHKKDVSLAQVEGFIRQILGWREFMRGVYWAHMPDYAHKNYFNHQRKLPQWYWTGKTSMKCLSHAINQSLNHAYAHHIQRLMVTGNFGLIAGVDPNEMDDWYLGVYIDAIEWVEITNTRGMSQFADGGIVGTKPYATSANYIHKMGHYCGDCHYKHHLKTGEKACPFNSLYWNFYHRNRNRLEDNPRIGMMYRTWDRMDPEKQKEILAQADYYLDHLDDL